MVTYSLIFTHQLACSAPLFHPRVSAPSLSRPNRELLAPFRATRKPAYPQSTPRVLTYLFSFQMHPRSFARTKNSAHFLSNISRFFPQNSRGGGRPNTQPSPPRLPPPFDFQLSSVHPPSPVSPFFATLTPKTPGGGRGATTHHCQPRTRPFPRTLFRYNRE